MIANSILLNSRTQALYQMCSSGLLSPEIIDSRPVQQSLPVEDAFAALGMRFAVFPLGRGSASSIDRGSFEQYARVEAPYMPYKRTQAAANLASRLAR